MCVTRTFLRPADAVPRDTREVIEARLREDAPKLLAAGAEKLAEEHFQPFWLAESPESVLGELPRVGVAIGLDSEIERQTEKGSWEPRRSWGAPPFRYRSGAVRRWWDAHRVPRFEHVPVVRGKGNLVALRSKELEGCQVKGIQRSHRCREGLERASENQRQHLQHGYASESRARGFA